MSTHKTCSHGHELTPDNLRVSVQKTGKRAGRTKTYCRACDRDAARRKRQENPERTKEVAGRSYQKTKARSRVYVRTDPFERITRRMTVDQGTGCWLWPGATNGYGHGKIGVDGKTIPTHRVTYERVRGSIPDGYHLHHVCRNPICCNPLHVVALPAGDHKRLHNEQDGHYHAIATHCKHGHEWTEENTRWYRGTRQCRSCDRKRENGWSRQRKARS